MRTVIISHNNDPLYSFFEPIVKFAWSKFGWDCKCYVTETAQEAQFIRLYAGKDFEGMDILMTSDIDMIPLSDYWHPAISDISCYGRDLSIEHQPICYVAMGAFRWKDIFENMASDISDYGTHWTADQDLLTDRVNDNAWDVANFNRGINPLTHYPIGRIDRSAWDKSLQQPERIDAHLLRPGYTDENWPRIMSLIKECLNPTQEEVEWLENYRDEFKNDYTIALWNIKANKKWIKSH